MAFANTSYSDILATTIESRSGEIADNVTDNNGLLGRLKKKGNVRTFSGGHKILEEISFAENSNFGWYSGYDTLSVAASDVISSAEYAIKQASVAVTISGLEKLQNRGKEQIIDLMDARLAVAEGTMANQISSALYGDGTGSAGKTITGLAAAVAVSPSTGTYGGIDRANFAFWRNYVLDTGAAPSAATIQSKFNTAWANLVRGSDHPDLIVVDNTTWIAYMDSLQAIQMMTDPEMGKLGFTTLKYLNADVLLDGGIGGNATSVTAFFLNTKYLHWRPHADRNMVALDPSRRFATNQDAEVQLIGFAGNLTCSGAQFQGRITFDA